MAADDRLNPNGADRSNWRDAPFSRWAFHNVREIIPVADIENDPAAPWPLPEARQSLAAFRLPLPGGASLDLDGFLAATATDAMVVLRDGRLVFEHYANGATRHTPHILMSASKAVTGLLAGILQRTGDLAIEALVSDYLPEIAGTAYQGATIRHLLDMRTGVVLDDKEMRDYEAASNWGVTAGGPGFHAFFANLPATASPNPHGGPFSYVSPNTDLLGWVMERATGRGFADLVSALLWKPMGAENGACITVDNKGAPRCTGGLCATARDFARIGQLVVQGGRRDGADIIPPDWIDDIARNSDRGAWRNGAWGESFAPISPDMSYRSGWYVINGKPQILFAMGVHGQNLFVDQANRLVIAKLSSQAGSTEFQAMGLTHRAIPEIRRCLLQAP